MRRGRWPGLIAGALIVTVVVLVILRAPASAASTVLSVLSGAVDAAHAERDFASAVDGDVLIDGDRIRTGSDGHALLTFFDASTLEVEPATNVVVQSAKSAGDAIDIRIQQTIGRTWSSVQHLTNPASRYEVHTPAAVAAVRGTGLDVTVLPEGTTTVRVTDGTVLVTAQGQSVLLDPGQQNTTAPGQAPGPAAPIAAPPNTLRFGMHSPAYIAVVDPTGRSCGIVLPGPTVVRQIPGCLATAPGVEPQIVDVPGASPGAYKIAIYGRSDGPFTLTATGVSGDKVSFNDVQGGTVHIGDLLASSIGVQGAPDGSLLSTGLAAPRLVSSEPVKVVIASPSPPLLPILAAPSPALASGRPPAALFSPLPLIGFEVGPQISSAPVAQPSPPPPSAAPTSSAPPSSAPPSSAPPSSAPPSSAPPSSAPPSTAPSSSASPSNAPTAGPTPTPAPAAPAPTPASAPSSASPQPTASAAPTAAAGGGTPFPFRTPFSFNGPRPTVAPTPTSSPTSTPTPIPTATATPTPTATATPTPTPTPALLVRGWGDNSHGQLGTGTSDFNGHPTPAPVMTGVTDVVAIAPGPFFHTLARKSDGTVWAAGSNGAGEIGDGTLTNRLTPVQVCVTASAGTCTSTLTNVVAIAANDASSFALKNDGTVWAWGFNGQGELGDGSTTNRSLPVQVCATVSTPGTCATALTNVVAIAGGRSEWAMALKIDGTVWTWGNNSRGELGNGSNASRSLVPVQVSGITTAVSIAAGDEHALALLSDGTLRGWGSNLSGQIGDGSILERRSPVTVCETITSPGTCATPLTGVTAIGRGDSHSLAVLSDGTVRAWGDNSSGDLGDGTTTQRSVPVAVCSTLLSPGICQALLSGVAAAAGGDAESAALKADGTVWAWGYNGTGALGDGTFTDRHLPVQSAGITSAMALGVGGTSTLAILVQPAAALAQSITFPVLGDRTPGDADFTVFASASSGLLVSFDAAGACTISWATVHLTGSGSCSVTASQAGNTTWLAAGDVVRTFNVTTPLSGWGAGTHGQLGNATTSSSTSPVRAGTLVGAISLAGGASHSLAVRHNGVVAGFGSDSGTIYAWGSNAQGQLGDGSTNDSSSPVLVSSFTGRMVSVAAGAFHSLALRSDGSVFSWGANNNGQLGTNTTSNGPTSTPVQVVGPGGTGSLTGITAIAAGGDHSLALKSDGTVWAWGSNGNGQIGDGTNVSRRTAPVQVTGLTGVIAIAAGQDHSIAVESNGTVWAWGWNGNGELGIGSCCADKNTPQQVSGISGALAAAAGEAHSLFLMNDGTVWATGSDANGQLGDGGSTQQNAPVMVSGITTAVAIAAGTDHSVALLQDGVVMVWGSNGSGQLARALTTLQSNTPLSVSGVESIDVIGSGESHVLAQTAMALADAARDFSAATNPNGDWRYGWSTTRGGTFNLLTTDFQGGLEGWRLNNAEPAVVRNTTNGTITPACCNPIPAGTLAAHPGSSGQNAIVRWTAPTAGTYIVRASFVGRDSSGTTTDVAVMKNTSTQLFAGNISGYLQVQEYATVLVLSAGDTVDVTVGFGNGSYFSDTTGIAFGIAKL